MEDPPKPKRRFRKILLWIFLALAAVIFLGWTAHRRAYPYGVTHKCNKGISAALSGYAEEHGGKFPDAGGSAESLSLLAKGDVPYPLSQLAGKAISDEDAERCFREKGKLTEDFCSWHYVRGLTTSSNPDLVLFWDKTGLSHNGMRQEPPRYEVCLVGAACQMISQADWPAFLARQEALLKEAGLSPDLLRD